VIVVLLIVGSIVSPVFFTVSNLAEVGQQSSALGVAWSASLDHHGRGMDLSLESTYGLAPMVAAWLMVGTAQFGLGTRWSPAAGILALLAVGLIVGLINGVMIVKCRSTGSSSRSR